MFVWSCVFDRIRRPSLWPPPRTRSSGGTHWSNFLAWAGHRHRLTHPSPHFLNSQPRRKELGCGPACCGCWGGKLWVCRGPAALPSSIAWSRVALSPPAAPVFSSSLLIVWPWLCLLRSCLACGMRPFETCTHRWRLQRRKLLALHWVLGHISFILRPFFRLWFCVYASCLYYSQITQIWI